MMDEFTQDNSEPTEQQMIVADDAVPLCPNCLRPCNPLDYYCLYCDSNEAINPLASYMPYVRIRFHAGMYGKLWRKSWSSETSPKLCWLYLLIAFLYQPVIFIIGLPFVILEKNKNYTAKDSHRFFSYIWVAVVFILYILFIMMINRAFYKYWQAVKNRICWYGRDVIHQLRTYK